jgi:hypothetical protein
MVIFGKGWFHVGFRFAQPSLRAVCLTVFLGNLLFISCSNAKAGLPAIPKASIFLDEIDGNN